MVVLVCDLCGQAGRYRCPRCDTRSCGLTCLKQHKKVSGCDGVRQKVKYIPVDRYTELNMVQDFRILEAATNTLDKCRRDKMKRSTNQRIDGFLPPRLSFKKKKLQSESSRRGVQVKFLPSHFERSKDNKSHFNNKTKTLNWDIDMELVHLEGRVVKLSSVPDTTKLWKLLSPVLEDDLSHQSLGFVAPDLGLSDEEKQVYHSMGYSGIIVYLRTETFSRNTDKNSQEAGEEDRVLPRYVELDLKRSIRHNLRGHALVEHPCLEIVSKWEACNFRDQMLQLPHRKTEQKMKEDDEEDCAKEGEDLSDTEDQENEESSDTQAYKKYYDFYMDYYTKKYANISLNKNQDQTFDRVIPQEQKYAPLPQHHATKLPPSSGGNRPRTGKPATAIEKRRNLDELNKKNVANARLIAAEIRDSVQTEKKTLEAPEAVGGASILSSLLDYSDSDGE